MKLRFAAQDDIASLLKIAHVVHAETRFAAMPLAEDKLRINLQNLIRWQEERQTHCVFLVETNEGEIIGVLIGALEEYFFTQVRSASSLLFWVASSHRGSAAALRMVSAFRDWAKQRGAVEVCILVASGITMRRTDRFLRRLGFTQTGGNYTMPLP